ncbi:MAG: rSAM-modified peptide [bacterium]|nr:rSAM-modified peptide [bacterium]
MKTKRIEKLSLNKETVASLEIQEMSQVQGGGTYISRTTARYYHCTGVGCE